MVVGVAVPESHSVVYPLSPHELADDDEDKDEDELLLLLSEWADMGRNAACVSARTTSASSRAPSSLRVSRTSLSSLEPSASL